MSDDDFMQDSDEEKYDFEYEEDEDDDDNANVDIENKYYNAKQNKQSEPEEAIIEFLGVPGLELEKGEWGFKGLKQAIKTEWPLGKYKDAVEHYEQLLTYIPYVMRNYSEKSINNMLDHIEKSSGTSTKANEYIIKIYKLTIASFKASNNERLWLKTTIKYAKLLIDRQEYSEAQPVLKELHSACQKEDGMDDATKGPYAIEIYAMDIRLNSALGNNKQLKTLYDKALQINSAVPHPKIMGVIKECGGKMYMAQEDWMNAKSDFFESFRCYDETGSLQRIQVLKYLLLTTMLMKSDINPFESQETKPYKDDPRIIPMRELVDAYQKDDVNAFQTVLDANPDIMSDPFIAENMAEVTRLSRIKGVYKLVAPYAAIRLSSIAKRLKISMEEATDIVGLLISGGKINGLIDEMEGTVRIKTGDDDEAQRLREVEELCEAVDRFRVAVVGEVWAGRDMRSAPDDTVEGLA